MSNSFLLWRLSSSDFVEFACSQYEGDRPRVKFEQLGKFELLVPPAAEQVRIVEKLEELLSDLDAGVAELKAAQRKLAQYRQSLLKAAVEGALTADWRAARARSGESQETGADLLQRILTERRARWEAKQLAKYAEQGKTPPKGWQAKYPEPNVTDAEELAGLPDGWAWSTLDQLSELITSGSRGWADYYASEGATFIRSQNINKDCLDLTDIAYVNPPRKSEGARTLVQRGDVLLTITGANVGKTACVDIDLDEAYVSQHVALIRPVELNLVNYLHIFLTCTSGGRGQLDQEAYGAGKPGLNLQQVAAVVVPIPSLPELAALMPRIEEQLVAVSVQHDIIERGLRQAAAQRKNILKAAFAGQLVPQNPNDESASALLERIRADRETNTPSTVTRGQKSKKTAR
jgi:type I restriction enzyme S subunit